MNKKELARLKRHRRIRMKMQGSKAKPRLVIKRSLNNLSAQVIDDTENKVLFSYSTANKEFKQKTAGAGNIKSAQAFGEAFSRLAKEKGISKIIFDRAGYLYHGRVKEFAESLRKGGMEF
ncbi:MAG: 50S ribosomal protein L18 [Candidatus Omnitrophica bacterium]|jgi:large subunit ribosomal protein L18|nr:50S ribosomal protein L18 [Candidatus Omnitrophota bacterium]